MCSKVCLFIVNKIYIVRNEKCSCLNVICQKSKIFFKVGTVYNSYLVVIKYQRKLLTVHSGYDYLSVHTAKASFSLRMTLKVRRWHN